MKRAVISLIIVSCLCFSLFAVAAPVNTFSGQEVFQRSEAEGLTRIKIAYVYEYLLERDLEDNSAVIEELNGNFLKFSYLYQDMVEVYALLGTLQFEVDESAAARSFETGHEFAWGVGGTARVFEMEEGITVNVDGQYRRSDSEMDKVSGVSATSDVDYQDWHAAVIFSKTFDMFTPYFGVKYSDVKISDAAGFTKNNSDKIFGPFLGFKVTGPAGRLALDMQGRFVDELGVSASIVYMF